MNSLRISQKLIIALIIISILPYALISYLNYSAEKEALEKKVFDHLNALAEAKNTHISMVINFRIAQVREIATSNFMQEMGSEDVSNLNFNLLRVKKEIPEFSEISAIDLNGSVIASTESRLIDKSYAEEEFFKVEGEKLYLGNISYHDNRTGYVISSPVLSRITGKPTGVLAVWIYPRLVYEVTGDYTGLGESGESLLVQKKGNDVVFLNPLRHNAGAALNLTFPFDSALAMPAIHAAKGEKGTIRALDYRGQEVFAAYTFIPFIEWGLVVKIDSSEALIPVTRFKERALLLGIFYFAVVATLAYLIGRRFTAPLIRLTDASKKIANRVLEIAVREAVRTVNVSYCSIVLVEEGKEYGTVAAEYSPRNNLKPLLGETLHFIDFPTLNKTYQEKQYVLVPDIQDADLSAKEKEIAERLNIRSTLAVPLVLGEKIPGIMQLSSLGEVKEFTEDETNICQTIANQVAIAIENAHLYSELKRHDQALEILFEIDKVVSESLYLDELLGKAIAKTIQVTSSDAGWIYLLQEDGETLKLETCIGISPELADGAAKLKVGQGVSGLAVKSGKPVTMDIENYPYTEFRSLMVKDGMSSLAGIPLIVKGKVVGAMVLSNRMHRRFSKEDIEVLESIGIQIGVAVENARLYSELKSHDKTLETLFEIDRVVSQSLDLGEIFREALAKTIQVTSSDAGAIYLIEDEGKLLKLKTAIGISPGFVRAVSEIKVGEGIAGGAAKTKKPFVTDIDHYPSRDLLPALEREGLMTLIATPLLAKGKVVGAMNLGIRRRRTFLKEDIDLLASIGSQIGVAIENARLYQEAKISYERLQAAYEELKSLDRMKSEFLSNVSHELKTPLVSIRGYSELMHDEKLGTIPMAQKKALGAIIRNTDRLTRLIDSLLFLSIQQMGKPELRMKTRPLPLGEIIIASVADMKVQSEKKKIDLIKDVPHYLEVMGDRDRLTEVFMNLLDNAIKFTPSGGKITVKAREEDEAVHITVTDTGIGIPENVIPSLFQRFYQADASTTRKYGGTGLGLYICKNIVDAHKGEIWVESKVGLGTAVHVRLPKKV